MHSSPPSSLRLQYICPPFSLQESSSHVCPHFHQLVLPLVVRLSSMCLDSLGTHSPVCICSRRASIIVVLYVFPEVHMIHLVVVLRSSCISFPPEHIQPLTHNVCIHSHSHSFSKLLMTWQFMFHVCYNLILFYNQSSRNIRQYRWRISLIIVNSDLQVLFLYPWSGRAPKQFPSVYR